MTARDEIYGQPCRCGSGKRTKDSFCRECFAKLTAAQQRSLYRRSISGYREAYSEACETLGETNE